MSLLLSIHKIFPRSTHEIYPREHTYNFYVCSLGSMDTFFADFLHRREAILVLIGYEFRKEDRNFYAKFLMLSMHKILPREHTYEFYQCSLRKTLYALRRRDFA